MRLKYLILLLLPGLAGMAQDAKQQLGNRSLLDTTRKTMPVPPRMPGAKKDSIPVLVKPRHDPHKATVRSAMIPGWGQAYNREYWKIPIVYGALAIPAVTFFYNNAWYKRTRNAYSIVVAGDPSQYNKIDPRLQAYINSPGSLQNARNLFLRNRDYSVLWFLILWGVNVIDATVFGHLKDFDVSDDLSMQVKPSLNNLVTPAATTQFSPGLSLVFNFSNHSRKSDHSSR